MKARRLALFGIVGLLPMAAGHADEQAPLSAEALIEQAAGGRDAFLPDFSYAGYGFGLAEIPGAQGRVIRVETFGAKAGDEVDDSEAFKQALDAARSVKGPVTIRLAPGRYILTEVLSLDRSDLVIQGAGQGMGGTEIHMPRPLSMTGEGARFDELRTYLQRYEKRQREPKRNLDVLFSEYSWTGGFLWVGDAAARPVPYLEELDPETQVDSAAVAGERGARTLTVETAEPFKAGQWIEVIWFSSAEDSGIIHSIYGDTDLKIGSHHWSFARRPLVRHRTKIEAISGNTLSLASPLPHEVSDAVPASVVSWQPLERVGIEDLSLTFPNAAVFGHHVEEGYNGIYVTGAADSWVRNVTVTNADSGILTDDAAHLTLRDIRLDGTRFGHYAVHMGSVQSVLAERIEVVMPVIHSLTFNTKSSRSVYKDAVVHAAAVLDQHAGSNHQNLFDNVTLRLSAKRDKDGPYYDVFDGSGAGYWQPGHGRYNTTWNLRLQVEGGMSGDETLEVRGLAEGPDARIVGLHANRKLTLDYRPEPITASLGQPVSAIPSLYAYQLERRRAAEAP